MAGMGYLVDMASVKLSDDNKSWIQAFPYGS